MRWSLHPAGLFAAALWMAGPAALTGQGVTTVGIRGTVVTDDDLPVDGAEVVVENEATGFTVGARVRHGRLLVEGLEVGGPYRIRVSALGFRPQIRDSVYLTLGEPLELRVVLQAAAVPLVPLVVSAAPNDEARGGTGTIVGDSVLHRLPTMDRDLYDFIGLAPQVTTGVGMSGGGAGIRSNAFVIQGVPERSLLGSQPPEFSGARSIPLSAVSQYEVLISPFDVRYSGFSGGLVNAVTRSGTNETRGSAFVYARNDALARKGATAGGLPYDRVQLGLSAGGPLRRDRLHYFVAAEIQALSSRAAGPYVGQPVDAVPRLPVDTASLRRLDEIMAGRWGLKAGSGGPIENHHRADNLFARVDLALPEWKGRGVAWLNAGLSGQSSFDRSTDGAFPLSSNMASQEFGFWTTGLQFHTMLGRAGGGHNEARLSHRANWIRLVPEVRQPIVAVEVPATTGDSVLLVTGSPYLSHTPALRSREVNVRDNLTLPLGPAHVATLGVEAQWFRVWGGGVLNAYGQWSFSGLQALEQGAADRYQVHRDFGSAAVPLSGAQFAIYAGDRWEADDQLTLTLGLRAELLSVRDRAPYHPVVDSIFGRRTDQMPVGGLHLSPRLGFVWDVSGARRDRIRGGVGVFTGRPPLAWLHSPLRRYGVGTGVLSCGFGPLDLGPPPRFDPDYRSPPVSCADSGGVTELPSDVDLLDPDLRLGQTLRTSLAYERRLPGGWLASVEALVSRGLADFLFVNRNLQGPQAVDRNGRVLYGTILASGNAAPVLRSDSFASVIELTNTDRTRSYQLSARLDKRFSKGAALTAAYAYSRVRDVQTPQRVVVAGRENWSIGRPVSGLHDDLSAGVSMNEVPHRIVLAGTYRTPKPRWSTEFSLRYIGEAGRPYTFVAWGDGSRGDLNADGSDVNDPVYVPRDAYDTTEIRFGGEPESVSAQQAAFERFIEGAPCLASQRGRIMERNSCRSPWTHAAIVSARQFIPVGTRRLEAQVDLFNVLNLVDPTWGLVRVPATHSEDETRWTRWTGTPALLEHVGQTTGPPDRAQSIFLFDTTVPRWRTVRPESGFQVQLAVRYRF